MAIDCEQTLTDIDLNVKALLEQNGYLADKLIEIDTTLLEANNKIINLENNLQAVNQNIVTSYNVNVDTNSVSKAILNYLIKIQEFFKI